MKSQQINFFLTSSDYAKLPELLQDTEFVLLDYIYSTPKAEAKTFAEIEKTPEVFFVLNSLLAEVKFRAVKEGFVPDVLESPIISFFKGNFSEKEIQRGRLYFVKDTADGMSKDALFIKKSQAVFRKFKKIYPQGHLEGYKSFYVSENAALLSTNGVTLVKI